MMTDTPNWNERDARAFLTALAPHGVVDFASFNDNNARPNQALAKRFTGTLQDLHVDLLALSAEGAGIFVTINETDGLGFKTENVTSVRAVFIDLDGSPLEPVTEWGLPPHIVVETSPGRWHAYWFVTGIEPAEFQLVQQELARKFGGDPKVCSSAQVMRLPGFPHQKGEPFMTRLLSIADDLSPITADVFRAKIELEPVIKPVGGSAPIMNESVYVIPDGERNTTLTSIAGRMRAGGAAADELLSALNEINESRCAPPLHEAEVRSIAASIAKYPINEPVYSEVAFSDTGNAERFVRQHADTVRFVPQNGKWLMWHGSHWEFCDASTATNLAIVSAKSLLNEAAKSTSPISREALSKHAKSSLSKAKLQAAVSLASAMPPIVVNNAELDSDDFLLGVENGVVDLRTGVFRPAVREDLITMRCAARYEPEATCPVFEAFLARVTGGDKDLQDYLQCFAGYAFSGSTREQIFAFVHGNGANGKSTFLEVLRVLMGGYATQTQPETLMASQRGGGASSDLARLIGKRLVISNEVREGAQFEENLIKQLVGGDRVTARFLYQEHFEFTPKFKLIIAGNHQPVIKGDDDGIWRRVHLIPFKHQIPVHERDKNLGAKLVMERSGILNWAIAGCLRWQKDGLIPPACITNATRAYRGEMDLLRHWIDQECITGPKCRDRSGVLYKNYRDWCEASAIRPLTAPIFLRKLESRGFEREHTRVGNFVIGVRLKSSGLAVAA